MTSTLPLLPHTPIHTHTHTHPFLGPLLSTVIIYILIGGEVSLSLFFFFPYVVGGKVQRRASLECSLEGDMESKRM